jgi:probable rRNA maturation factor
VTRPAVVIELDVAPEVALPVDPSVVAAAVRQAIATIQEHDPEGARRLEARPMHVGIRINGDAEMQELNRTYRGVDRPTDVLSFAFTEGEPLPLPPDAPVPLGEVAVDIEYARRQAAELQHSLDMELSWLVIHGTLQLLGYHHAKEEEAEHMESLETAALRALGFKRN